MRTLPVLGLVAILTLLAAPPCVADFICGCGNEECDDTAPQDLPAVQFQVWFDGTELVGQFDSNDPSGFVFLDPSIREAMVDGRLSVRYMGEDRRADLGDGSTQNISVHFWHLGPSKAPTTKAELEAFPKHADGDANTIPVFGEGPVQNWNGLAESIIHFGNIAKGEGLDPCQWLITRDVVWGSLVPVEAHSWGTIKARF